MSRAKPSKRKEKSKTRRRKRPPPRRKKPVRNKDNPVRVVFQCRGGTRASSEVAREFELYLQKKGWQELFKIEIAGISVQQKEVVRQWQETVSNADLLVSFLPLEFYTKYGFRLPKKVKPFQYFSYWRPKQSLEALAEIHERLFSRMITRAKRKFNMRDLV